MRMGAKDVLWQKSVDLFGDQSEYAPEKLIRIKSGYAALPVTVCDSPKVI